VVYLGDDLEAGRAVAIKVLKDDIASGVAVGRFLREITIHTRVPHENIVQVLDSGEVDGVPFLVLPYVANGSLRQRLQREGQLPWDDVLRVTRDVGSALDAAHKAGVIHRDVKPENILLGTDQALLADFGIARAFSEAATERLPESGIVIGTAGYMSPEQCEGIRELNARSDLYSLACVTYEMLAGEPPYTGPTRMAVAAKQLTLPVPSVRLLRTGLPEAVDAVFRKALAKVPADRYQDASHFEEALVPT
jgi:serine/threonine-protein kinase